MSKAGPAAVLLISCPDRRGLIAGVTDFIYRNNGNIEHLDQHVDPALGVFFMRIEWSLDGFSVPRERIHTDFSEVAAKFSMEWKLHFSDERPKFAIFVSKSLHCLYDILSRYREGWFNAEIPVIISNHRDAEDVAGFFGIDFKYFDVTGDNKISSERKQMDLLKGYGVNFIVLARYMQILTKQFVDAYRYGIINIHHSFLPAFAGARPYEQAHSRGVKIIGATSHYVTEDLDEGPIIEQDVVRVSHRDSVEDIRKKGQDLEKVVLSRALNWHLDRRILVYGPSGGAKTVVFD